MAAALVLLAAAVLLHLGTPHHFFAAPVNPVAATVVPGDGESKPHDGPERSDAGRVPVAAALHGGALGAPHHEAQSDALVLPARSGHPDGASALAADVSVDEAHVNSAAPDPARSRAARDVRDPGGGRAPALSALQSFRR
ncbi:hypothetical protein [Streptomyces sp. BK239]|uniref:hypothetical protein n=1 Tax=Streptomyces sp. BK239 TaxID=2512155 RepID=UPI00102BF039|nr:hypothetical protein [Streptomyces sp. BK239]RZU18024.1 hypothetical protein EV567_2944 [Streptomyces sp. BK239]